MDSENDIGFKEYGLIVVFILGLSILTVYSFFHSLVYIDFYSIILLIILGSLPFFPSVTKLIVSPKKGFQFERNTERIREEAETTKKDSLNKLKELEETLEEDEEGAVESDINNKVNRVKTEMKKIQHESNPQAALMFLSTKIEKELRKLLEEEGITEVERVGLYKLIEEARKQEVLNEKIIHALEEIRPLRNKIVHGEEVNAKDAESLLDIGLNIFETLMYERGTLEVTQETISKAIRENPEIIERGLSIVELEKRTDYGVIDMLGKDSKDRDVIIEIKSTKAKESHIKQLIGFVTSMEDYSDEVRGILVSPSVRERVSRLETGRIKVKEIDITDLI